MAGSQVPPGLLGGPGEAGGGPDRRPGRHRNLLVGGVVAAVIAVAVVLAVVLDGGSSPSSTAFPAHPTTAAQAGPASAGSGGSTGLPGTPTAADGTGQSPTGALPGTAVAASGLTGGAGPDGIAIPVGPSSAPVKLTVFEDFRCPICDDMEKAGLGTIMQRYAALGKIQIQYHIASFIDRNEGGTGSRQAANAAACAQDADSSFFVAFHNTLYANQPSETDDGFGEVDHLLLLAATVPGLVTPTFTQCVKTDAHAAWVLASQADFDRRGITGTPTVILNGTQVPVTASSQSELTGGQYDSTTGMMTPQAFQQTLDQALSGAGGA